MSSDAQTSSVAGHSERIWVRACQLPHANLNPRKSIDFIGGNQGNLLYQFSTHRNLVREGAEVSTISYGKFQKGAVEDRAEMINSGCDRLVLPLSSSFRLQNVKGLQEWADLVERLTVPVTVVGIGAQLRLTDVEQGTFLPSRVTGVVAGKDEIAEHETAARRFVTAVLERSESIGVRGEVTKRYLEYLGFESDRIDVIGCPSLFMWGPDFQVTSDAPRLTRRSALSLSFDHRIKQTADLLDTTLDDYPKSLVYMQEKLGAQMVITGEETRESWNGDDRFPVKTSHRAYGERRLEYWPTGWSWIRHLDDVDFAFGPRLHGTVASILAGTPAHLLVHDSRTLEVAQHHRLPHTLTDDLVGVDAASLAAASDFSAFNAAHPGLYTVFAEFLARNGLTVGDPSTGTNRALAEFDASLEPAAQAKGVRSGEDTASSVRQRLGALRRRVLPRR